MENTYQNKIFPQRLPKDFHGPIRPPIRIKPIADPSSQQIYQPQKQGLRLNAWKRRKSDKELQREKKLFISHPTRNSQEGPDWLRSTFFYQQRALQHQKSKKKKRYNVFGIQQNYKVNKPARFPLFDSSPFQIGWSSTSQSTSELKRSKMGLYTPDIDNYRGRIIRSHYESRKEVTPKIGICLTRDFSPAQATILKIGHNQAVDTYSVL